MLFINPVCPYCSLFKNNIHYFYRAVKGLFPKKQTFQTINIVMNHKNNLHPIGYK